MTQNILEPFRHLKVGAKTRVTCCGRGTTMIVSRDRQGLRGYCFKCGATPRLELESSTRENVASLRAAEQRLSLLTASTSPTALTLPNGCISALPMAATLWLAERSISPVLSARLSMQWCTDMERLILPCFDRAGTLVYWQGRALESWRSPKYLTKESMLATSVTFDSRTVVSPLVPDGPTILTEDIISGVRVGHVYPSHALLGTALTDGKLLAITKDNPRELLTWFDNDAAGAKARKQASRRFPLLGFRVRHIRTDLDPKAYSNRRIMEIVQAT